MVTFSAMLSGSGNTIKKFERSNISGSLSVTYPTWCPTGAISDTRKCRSSSAWATGNRVEASIKSKIATKDLIGKSGIFAVDWQTIIIFLKATRISGRHFCFKADSSHIQKEGTLQEGVYVGTSKNESFAESQKSGKEEKMKPVT